MAEEKPKVWLVQEERWKEVWTEVRELGTWSGALEFLNEHPGASNNRTPWSGCTLMVQAMFYGVDKGVLKRLKDCGADPNIRDFQGRLPIEHCQSESQKEKMQALLQEVYGPDDKQARLQLVNAAKEGDLTGIMTVLKQKPHLANTQSYRGWTVLHQVCFHGATESLLATLVQLKACLEIQNDEGHTPRQVHELSHPPPPPRNPPNPGLKFPGDWQCPSKQCKAWQCPRNAACSRCGSAKPTEENSGVAASSSGLTRVAKEEEETGGSPTALRRGMAVVAHSVDRSFRGEVQEIRGGVATIAPSDGEPVTLPVWRVVPVLDTSVEFTAGLCCICGCAVPTTWKISPECQGEPHLYCGACTVNFVWTQFEHLPMKCVTCQAPVDPGKLGNTEETRTLARSLRANWPPACRRETTHSFLSFDDFVQNVRKKMEQVSTEEEQRQHRAEILWLLEHGGFTDRPIAYCHESQCPKYRACPNCGVCIEYAIDCKHMTCAKCNHEFCFLCLRTQAEHTGNYNWRISEKCPIAPIQRELPPPLPPH